MESREEGGATKGLLYSVAPIAQFAACEQSRPSPSSDIQPCVIFRVPCAWVRRVDVAFYPTQSLLDGRSNNMRTQRNTENLPINARGVYFLKGP